MNYRVRLLEGDAKLSFIMDHGRTGPQGALNGQDGEVNRVVVGYRDGSQYHPKHLSKDQGIAMGAGDYVEVWTPGGGGYGDPLERPADAVARDVFLGYYTSEDAANQYGVVLQDGSVDQQRTHELRARMRQ